MTKEVSDLTVAVMQPYFFPYAGYWQLMAGVDVFVVHENLKYVKQSWINRNRILVDGKPKWFTIPVVGGPDSDLISAKRIALEWKQNVESAVRKLQFAYGWSSHFSAVMDWLSPLLQNRTESLYAFLRATLIQTHLALDLGSKLVFEDNLEGLAELKGKNRLLEICRQTGAKRYVNLPGGRAIYDQEDFDSIGVQLLFHDPQLHGYAQNSDIFVPGLSILDMLFSVGFFEASEKIHESRWSLETGGNYGSSKSSR